MILDKRKIGTRFLTAVVASSLIVTPAMAAPSVNKLKENKAAKQNEVKTLQQELTDILTKLGTLEEGLIKKGEEISQAEDDLVVAEEKEKEQYEAMKLRIKYMYEGGNLSAFEALAGVTNFSDLVNKAEYVQSVHRYDREQLAEYVETKQEISDLKTSLEEDQKAMESLQTEYEDKETELNTTIEAKRAEVADLDVQIQAAAEAAAREAEARRRQEEESRRAQTAAGGTSSNRNSSSNRNNGNTSNNTANEANNGTTANNTTNEANNGAAANNTAGNNNGANQTPDAPAVDNNTNNNTSNTNNNAANTNNTNNAVNTDNTANTGGTNTDNTADNTGNADNTVNNSTGTTSSTDTSASNTNSSTTTTAGNAAAAQTIVSAAYSQLGVPYVWGGSTPGQGLDCSGLVQYCHSVAGLSLGRTSQVQGGGGKAVTNPQPGDIVCYGSHVGIYIGGGQMIHAPRTGEVVKVASVYGSPWYRRYW